MIDPVRAEAIRTLMLQIRSQTAAGFVVAGYMVGTAAPFTAGWMVALWGAGMIVAVMARWAVCHFFQRMQPPEDRLPHWARLYTLSMTFIGLMYGLAFLLFAHPAQPITVALTMAALYSLAAGSVPTAAYHPVSIYGVVVPAFAAVLGKLLATGDFGYILLGAASALYGVTMIGYCKLQAKTLDEGFRIRFERQELLDALTREKAEAEQARRQAEQASLAKSQFLAAASHDLRQPLYALGLFSSSLNELRLDERGRDVVRRIQNSIGVMDSLFDGLLDLSKLEAGVVEPKLAAVSVDDLFDRIAQVFRPLALERGLELRLRCEGEWAWSDRVLLEQVLGNLVSNAIRWTRKGGVLVAVRRRRDGLRFEVWDTGVGIAETDLRRIFDDYVQRDRRMGLGLGLSIAKRSIALIGSRIEVASRVGRGSFFSFTQPLAEPPADKRADDRDVPVRAIARDPDLPVLLVEDDEDVRLAFADLLERWGVPMEAVATAAAALERVARGQRYGLVISDQRLTGAMSGLELIGRLRTDHRHAPPAVLITGDWDRALIQQAQAENVPILAKPVQPARLRALLGLPLEVGRA
jgi:two-component system, sensor histidine kinase